MGSPTLSGLSASQPAADASQLIDEGEGEGEGKGEGEGESEDENTESGGVDGVARPEEEEEEEEERRRRVGVALEEQNLASTGGGEGGEGGGEGGEQGGGEASSSAAPTKLPTIELRGLQSVTIGNKTYTIGGKREFKLVGPHQKLKMQADLDDKGLHKVHISFSSICGMGQPPLIPGSSEAAIAVALCARSTHQYSHNFGSPARHTHCSHSIYCPLWGIFLPRLFLLGFSDPH